VISSHVVEHEDVSMWRCVVWWDCNNISEEDVTSARKVKKESGILQNISDRWRDAMIGVEDKSV
jgi:hypothetical protein